MNLFLYLLEVPEGDTGGNSQEVTGDVGTHPNKGLSGC